MTDLLTKEERETVERLRQYIEMPLRCKKSGRLAKSYCDNLLNHTRSLFDILDNLSKRGVKKYSEEELRAEFLRVEKKDMSGLSTKLKQGFDNRFEDEDVNAWWLSWMACARFLGALEEK